jgi:hypothetical protein
MKKTVKIIFCLLGLFMASNAVAQKIDSTTHRNIGFLVSGSILENKGFRIELPTFFYSSKRHGFSLTSAAKFEGNKSPVYGVSAGYFYFIEPSFRDISFFLNYNGSYYFDSPQMATHIFGGGVQIDLLGNFFLHHSVGLGFQHSTTSDRSFLNISGQLKLSIGYYLREIPEVHIKDDWEH